MANRFDFYISTQQDLCDAVEAFGIVPLFQNAVPGFSVEEHVDPRVWFGDGEGVWEWKGPVIRETGCAYGKFLFQKAAFISREWFLDFANFRRCGDDFDTLYENGEAPRADKRLYDLIAENGPVLSSRLKYLGDYRRGGHTGFDTTVTRLQAQTYVLISDFVYQRDRFGNPYGWGVCEYSTPEQWMGEPFTAHVYEKTPEESYARLLAQIASISGTNEAAVRKFL